MNGVGLLTVNGMAIVVPDISAQKRTFNTTNAAGLFICEKCNAICDKSILGQAFEDGTGFCNNCVQREADFEKYKKFWDANEHPEQEKEDVEVKTDGQTN